MECTRLVEKVGDLFDSQDLGAREGEGAIGVFLGVGDDSDPTVREIFRSELQKH
jgi:hypothetical protein